MWLLQTLTNHSEFFPGLDPPNLREVWPSSTHREARFSLDFCFSALKPHVYITAWRFNNCPPWPTAVCFIDFFSGSQINAPRPPHSFPSSKRIILLQGLHKHVSERISWQKSITRLLNVGTTQRGKSTQHHVSKEMLTVIHFRHLVCWDRVKMMFLRKEHCVCNYY